MQDEWLFVIDDDEAMLSLLGEFLDSVGYQVRQFRSAHDAIRVLDETPGLSVRAVISDIHMPVMNGFEFMEWFCEKITAPVILLSAFGSPELENKALEAGASFFMKKPFALSALKQALDHLLKAS